MNLLRKFWNSNSITQLATLSAKPLNLLIFTPILLIKLNSYESTLFYLFASNAFFSDFVMRRVSGVFVRALTLKLNTSDSNQKKNWESYWIGFKTLQLIQRYTAFIGLILVLLLNYVALQGLMSSNKGADIDNFYVLLILSVLRPFISSFGHAYNAAQRASGNVSLNNRISLVYIILQNLCGVIVLKFGGGLLGILSWLAISEILYRLSLAYFMRLLKKRTYSGRIKPCSNLAKEMLNPIIKNLSTAIAYSSSRISISFLPMFFTNEFVGNFMFTQFLLVSCNQAGLAVWHANHPTRLKNYCEGELNLVRKSVKKSLFVSSIIYSLSLVSILVLFTYLKPYFSFSKDVLAGWLLLILIFSSLMDFITGASNVVGRIFDYNIEFKSTLRGALFSIPLLLGSLLCSMPLLYLLSINMPYTISNSLRGFRLFNRKVNFFNN